MLNFLGKNDFIWFFGVVEDRNDPIQLGRVRVRAYGWHTDDKNEIPTESLPWAIPLQSITSAAVSGKGTSPTGILEGTWVVGFFADGKDASEPYILGSFAGIPQYSADSSRGFNDPNGVYPKYVDESDVNKLARGTNTITKSADTNIGAPADSYKAEYPYNHVTETESGHIIEVDDTDGNERIHVFHKSGTFIEMQPNGDVVTQHKNGFRTVTGNDKLHVTKDLDIIVDGNINLSARKNINITALGNIDARATRIDLNNGTPSLPDAQLIDPPVVYEENVVNIEPHELDIEEGVDYPDNPEQVEQTDGKNPEDVNYPEKAPATCGAADNPQRNPIDVATELMNEGGWKETGSNPKIKFLWDEIGYDGSRYADRTAWCAVFAGAVLKRSGNKYIQTASSQAYSGYGTQVAMAEGDKIDLSNLKRGDILVFQRGGSAKGTGHVAFATGDYTDTHIGVIGGNQSNSITQKRYKLRGGFFWRLRAVRRAVACDDGTTEPPTSSML